MSESGRSNTPIDPAEGEWHDRHLPADGKIR
jgi:hypothetical protein